MGAAGVFLFGQQASSMLDAEFDKLSPELGGALHTINDQITQGFSTTQIALAAVALPVIYQIIKIGAGYGETHRDGIAERRKAAEREHVAKLEREAEILRAQLARGIIPGVASPTPSPPAP